MHLIYQHSLKYVLLTEISFYFSSNSRLNSLRNIVTFIDDFIKDAPNNNKIQFMRSIVFIYPMDKRGTKVKQLPKYENPFLTIFPTP